MNKFQGEIINTRVAGNLTLLEIEVSQSIIKAIVVDNPTLSPYLNIGSSVNLLFKATEVIIAQSSAPATSVINALPCQIQAIKKGEILDEISLNFMDYRIKSIVPNEATSKLHLTEGKDVYALIKINEVMIAKIN